MEQDNRKTFGQTIAEARKEKGLNLTALASQLVKEDGAPITYQYLADLENDRRNPPSDYLIEQLALKLDIPELYLYVKARRFPPALDTIDNQFSTSLSKFLSRQLKGAKAA